MTRPLPPQSSAEGTVGVEEEFLVVDAATRGPVPGADLVLPAAARLGAAVTGELTPMQVELITPVCTTLAEVGGALARGRLALARAAASHGWRIAASGTPALTSAGPPPLCETPRYQALADRFGSLVDEQGTCGLHIHVGVPDRDEAIRACGHLRPWLACLLAISANSPFHAGRDTGYASWRAVVAGRWPTIGPPPVMDGLEGYHQAVGRLRHHGVAEGEQDVYWWARPSATYPTVEIRIADTQPTVADTLLVAALARAAVLEALDAVRRGVRPPCLEDAEVNAMIWRAARDGMAHPRTGDDPASAVAVRVQQLVRRLRPRLEQMGDLATVIRLRRRMCSLGTGADRQRAAVRQHGGLHAAVDAVIFPVTVQRQ